MNTKFYDLVADDEKRVEWEGKWRNVYIGKYYIYYGEGIWDDEKTAREKALLFLKEWQTQGPVFVRDRGEEGMKYYFNGTDRERCEALAVKKYGRNNIMFYDELVTHFPMPVGDA